MAKKIHYDDNLFYIREIIKSLKKGFSVEIDNDYFMDKVIEDIYFIDAILRRLCANLFEHDQLIKRPEVLRSVMVSITQFIEALEIILDKPGADSFFQSQNLSKFRDITVYQKDEQQRIKKILIGVESSLESDDQVSKEEFDLLLHEPK